MHLGTELSRRLVRETLTGVNQVLRSVRPSRNSLSISSRD